MKECFYKLTPNCSNTSQILEYAISVENTLGQSIWNDKSYFNLDDVSGVLGNVIPLPNRFVEPGSVFDILKREIGLHFSIGKMIPNTFYNLHKDKKRKFAINLILNDYDSITFFSVEKLRDKQHHIVELNYQPEQFYLLDVLTSHAVLNRSKDRYFLTAGTITHSFDEMFEILKSLNLINQNSL